MHAGRVDTVIFDVGNVLLRWNWDPLLADLSGDPETEAFVREHVITHDWNIEMDAGKSWAEGCAERAAAFPDHAHIVHGMNERWEETLHGTIDGTVDILERLHASGVPLYALTNFSSDKFWLIRPKNSFFDRFIDILVSGDENMVKPDPAIYHLLLERNGLDAGQCVFIDDSAANIASAQEVGLETIHFVSPEALALDLSRMGFPAERDSSA